MMSYAPRRTSTPIALCDIFRVAVIFDLYRLSACHVTIDLAWVAHAFP